MPQFAEVALVASIKGLTTFNSGMSQMRRQMSLTGRSTSTFASLFNGQMGGIGKTVLGAGRTIRGFGNELVFLGFQLTFLATGAFAAIVTAGSEFESTIVRMTTLATATTDQLQGLADTALALGPALGTGPTEMANAMFDIVSSGFSAAEAMEIIQVTAKAAAIGLGDVRTVTDAVTSAMRAFSEDGLDAGRATDILVQAVREGKGEVDQLAGSIGRVLGIAGEMGLTFEQTAAFIATFTRVGVPAEVAITSLRSALTNILKPTATAETALEKYGLTIDDIRSIISDPKHGLQDALILLATIMEDDSEAFGDLIGSARGLAGTLIVTGPLLEDYQQVLSSIEQSTGATADAFDFFAQTTEFKVAAAKASLESLFITISNAVRPLVNLLLEQIPKIAAAISQLAAENPKLFLLAGAFAAVVAAAGPLLIVGGLMITTLGTFISVVGATITVLGSLATLPGLIIGPLVALAAAFVGVFVASFKKTREKLAEQGRAISFDAYAWGRNIVIQFARGIAAAAVYVIKVLVRLGTIIRDLLRPGSPPKLLPDIDKWGKGAMEAYMAGWLQADFNVFQEIAGTIEQFLRSMNIPDIGVVPAILEIRTELARLLEQFRLTGTVASGAIKNITDQFGAAGDIVGRYIQAMLDVEAATKAVTAAQLQLTEAQENLNDIQEKYNALLAPINDELEAIARRRQEVADDMRIAELQAIVNDENAPALAKELALMELREIELRRQAQAIGDKQETEEEAAQSAIDAAEEALALAQEELKLAEERVQALHQFIQVQQENNALIKEQISLLESLRDAMGGAAGGLEEELTGAGDLGDIEPPDIGGMLDDLDPPEDLDELLRKLGGPGGPDDLGLGELDLFANISGAADELVAEFQGIGEEIAAELQPAIDAFDELTEVWSDIFSTDFGNLPADSPIMVFLQSIRDAIDDSNIREFTNNFDPIAQTLERFGVISPLLGIAAEAMQLMLDTIIGLVDISEGDVGTFLEDIAKGLESIGVHVGDFDTLPELFNVFFLDPLTLVVGAVLAVVTAFALFVTATIQTVGVWQEQFAAAKLSAEDFFDGLTTIVGDIVDDVLATFGAKLVEWGGDIEKEFLRIQQFAAPIWIEIKKSIITPVNEFVISVLQSAGELFEGLVGEDGFLAKISRDGAALFLALATAAIAEVTRIQGEVETIFDNFGVWLSGQVATFRQWGIDIGSGLIAGIMEAIAPIIELVEGLMQTLAGAVDEENESGSPAQVYVRKGHDMMEGLVVGIMERAAGVISTMQEVMEQTSFVANSVVQGAIPAPDRPPTMYNSQMRESNFGPINIYGGIDLAALRVLIRQEVNGAL